MGVCGPVRLYDFYQLGEGQGQGQGKRNGGKERGRPGRGREVKGGGRRGEKGWREEEREST